MRRHRDRFLRPCLLAALCLFLGLLTTVALTWLLVHRYCHARWSLTRLDGGAARASGWPLPVPADWPPPNRVFLQESAVTSWSLAFHHVPPTAEEPDPPAMLWSHVITGGWPARALLLEQRSDHPQPAHAYPPPRWVVCSWRGGLWRIRPETTRYDEPTLSIVGEAYPWFPVWPGLAINTALCGAAWAGLILLPIVLARAIRRRGLASRGLCPACRYDRRGLADSAPCPECGAALC
jgi:hypothetical protein